MSDNRDVEDFHIKFGVPMPDKPMFLNREAFRFRVEFMLEELNEFIESHQSNDMHGAADALIDLAYVVHGTALMMGLDWKELWNEVQRANMSKVRANHASESKRGTSLDVVKPKGWVGPDHTNAVGEGPWEVHNG